MTHAEMRARLRAYADGTLVEAEAESVRNHLATGCETCLAEVFARPVGLPRPAPVVIARPRWGWIVGVVAAAAGLGVAFGAIVGARRQAARSDAMAREAARELEGLRAERSTLTGEVKALEAQATRSREMQEELARAQQRLADVERRIAAPAPAAPPDTAPAADADTPPAWLDDLLSSSGTRAAPLRAAPFARDARGYALWSPSRGLVVVVASELPRGDALVTYRVKVLLDDGSTVWIGDLGASEPGALTVSVALPDPAHRRVVAVDLYRDPPGTSALTARLRP